jgi:hypothetical protein
MTATQTFPTDPDSDHSRLRRACNQFFGEPSLFIETVNESAETRLIRIRTMIFRGFSDVWGRVPAEIIEQESVTDWPNRITVRDILWPAFMRFIQITETSIATTPITHRETVALRFSVLIYFFGILIHPSIDANGQSFRLLALTYLRQYSPKRFAHALFPIKYIQDFGESLNIRPITTQMSQVVLDATPRFSPDTPEGVVKESIVHTLLSTTTGLSFLHAYLYDQPLTHNHASVWYSKTANAFLFAFTSLETDFASLIAHEALPVHKAKHAVIQRFMEHHHYSLDTDFIWSETDRKDISAALKATSLIPNRQE